MAKRYQFQFTDNPDRHKPTVFRVLTLLVVSAGIVVYPPAESPVMHYLCWAIVVADASLMLSYIIRKQRRRQADSA